MNDSIVFQPVIDEKTILIVDDSNITRNLIEKIYKDQYKILMADDGRGSIYIVKEIMNVAFLLIPMKPFSASQIDATVTKTINSKK